MKTVVCIGPSLRFVPTAVMAPSLSRSVSLRYMHSTVPPITPLPSQSVGKEASSLGRTRTPVSLSGQPVVRNLSVEADGDGSDMSQSVILSTISVPTDKTSSSVPEAILVVRNSSTKMTFRCDNPTLAERIREATTSSPYPDPLDAHGLFCFSQGATDYRWRALPKHENVKVPVILRGDTAYNRVRLFGMPKGYPNTTSPGFQRFFYLSQANSFVSNFASSIGFQSLLNGFFLGSSPQLWMLKDLVPALLAAYLANRVVSYENRPKFWFSLSVFMSNVSVISDMLIPSLVPQHLLSAAIITSTVKQSSSLMYFVSRAAALQHFATHNNLAELTKKFNSFGMVNYTVATALGIVYCTYIANFTVQLVTAVVCCAANMVLAPMSMNPIAFRILNFTTIHLLMHAYVKERRVLTPDDVSMKLGVRMVPNLPDEPRDRTALILVSPPIDKLIIHSDTLEEDVLYANDNGMFMLGLWAPSTVPMSIRECWDRWELPTWCKAPPAALGRMRRLWCKKADTEVDAIFGEKRLVLLVHTRCTPPDLITAYMVMYTAVLQHATTELELRTFLSRCHEEQKLWQERAADFRESLRHVNWDCDLPAIDHPDFRLSKLFAPASKRSLHGHCS